MHDEIYFFSVHAIINKNLKDLRPVAALFQKLKNRKVKVKEIEEWKSSF